MDFQEDFYAIVDWANKIDPLMCISMYGVTEQHISDQKVDAAAYVGLLLDALEDRITTLFIHVSYNFLCYSVKLKII